MPRYQKNRQPQSLVRTILVHPVLWSFVSTLVIMLLASLLWQNYESDISKNMEFELTADKIELVHDEPAWVRTSISDQLLNQSKLPKSLLATNLVDRLSMEVQSVGWVARVNQIRKSSDKVSLDLTYRQPTALVVFPRTPHTVPVDADGVVMDETEMERNMIADLPRIHVFQPASESLVTWAPWPDERIHDGVKLANFIGRSWKTLGFYQIVTKQKPGTNAKPEPFELYPKKGAVLIWGSAPGEELENEASAEKKFKAVAEFVLEYGSFDQTNPDYDYDVRSGRLIKVRKIRTALDSNGFLKTLQ